MSIGGPTASGIDLTLETCATPAIPVTTWEIA
jgi:hypothetical protein